MKRIYVPGHLSDPASIEYRSIAKQMIEFGHYDDADKNMIETLAILRIRIRKLEQSLEPGDDTDLSIEDRIAAAALELKVQAAINSTASTILRISDALKLTPSKRASDGKPGRPRKNAGITPDPGSKMEWGNVLKFDGK